MARANTSSAYQDDYYTYSKEQQPKKKKIVNAKVSTKARKRKRFKTIMTLLAVFAVAFVIVLRYAYIAEKNDSLNEMKTSYQEISSENNMLQIEIDQNINLTKVEEIATTKLGMQKPQKHQIVYVNVVGDDKIVTKNGGRAEADTEPPKNNGFFAAIISIMGDVLEYLY